MKVCMEVLYYGFFFKINLLNHFFFAGTTSSLKITTPLNYKRKPFHVLEILAFDGSSHATCQMKVVVEKTNENYLTASQACFQAHLSENKKNIKDLITIPGRFLNDIAFLFPKLFLDSSPIAIAINLLKENTSEVVGNQST